MHFKNLIAKSLVAVFALTLTLSLNSASLGTPAGDDKSDAWVGVKQMIEFIGMGHLPGVERGGNDALSALEKAIDKEQDSGKKDKMIDAKTKVREALAHAGRSEWPYAEGAAKRALELIESVK